MAFTSRAILLLTAIVYQAITFQVIAAEDKQQLATVGDEVITLSEYHIALREEARQRFYHGQPTEGQVAIFRREVAGKLVDRALLLQEVKRRDIKIDEQGVEAELDKYRQRIIKRGGTVDKDGAFWQALRQRVEQEAQIEGLRKMLNSQLPSDEALIKKFYQDNPDKFTEPEQARVSLILLKVDPSATAETWQAARQEAAQLHKRLQAGEDFSELARLHSGDATSKHGGDMGYIHSGMLGESVQAELDKLALKGVSEPIQVLEGMALFRVAERKPEKLHSYVEVSERAQALWRRQQEESAWQALLENLRTTTPIKRSEHYPAAESLDANNLQSGLQWQWSAGTEYRC